MNKKILLTIVGLSTILLSACKSTSEDYYSDSSVDGLSHFYVDEMDVVNYTVQSELSAIKASKYYITDEKLKVMNGDIGLFNWEQFPNAGDSIFKRSLELPQFDRLYNDVLFSNFSRFCNLKNGNIVSEELVYLPNVMRGATYHICQINNKYSSAVVIKHHAESDKHSYYIDAQVSSVFKESLKELSPKTTGGWLLLSDGNLVRYNKTVKALTYRYMGAELPIPLFQSIFFTHSNVRVYFKDTFGKYGNLISLKNFYIGREKVTQDNVGRLRGASLNTHNTIKFEMENGETTEFSAKPDKKYTRTPTYLRYKGEKIRAIFPDGYDSQLSKEQVTALIDEQIQYDYSKIDSEDDWKLLTTIYKNWDLSRLDETIVSQLKSRMPNEPVKQSNIVYKPKKRKVDDRLHKNLISLLTIWDLSLQARLPAKTSIPQLHFVGHKFDADSSTIYKTYKTHSTTAQQIRTVTTDAELEKNFLNFSLKDYCHNLHGHYILSDQPNSKNFHTWYLSGGYKMEIDYVGSNGATIFKTALSPENCSNS